MEIIKLNNEQKVKIKSDFDKWLSQENFFCETNPMTGEKYLTYHPVVE